MDKLKSKYKNKHLFRNAWWGFIDLFLRIRDEQWKEYCPSGRERAVARDSNRLTRRRASTR